MQGKCKMVEEDIFEKCGRNTYINTVGKLFWKMFFDETISKYHILNNLSVILWFWSTGAIIEVIKDRMCD
jgi:hypothetical protein